jgi:hypothetical protein
MAGAGRAARGSSGGARRTRWPRGRAGPRSQSRALADGHSGSRPAPPGVAPRPHIVGLRVEVHPFLGDLLVVGALEQHPDLGDRESEQSVDGAALLRQRLLGAGDGTPTADHGTVVAHADPAAPGVGAMLVEGQVQGALPPQVQRSFGRPPAGRRQRLLPPTGPRRHRPARWARSPGGPVPGSWRNLRPARGSFGMNLCGIMPRTWVKMTRS